MLCHKHLYNRNAIQTRDDEEPPREGERVKTDFTLSTMSTTFDSTRDMLLVRALRGATLLVVLFAIVCALDAESESVLDT